jgi:GxxExxY protein
MAHHGGSRRALPARALRHGLSDALLQDRACADAIDAAFAVHEALGAWHEAATYKNALAAELTQRKLAVSRDATLSVVYQKKVVGSFPADLIVQDRLLVLVRAERALTEQARTDAVRGVQMGGVRVGLVFNFALDELFFSRLF